MVLRCLMSRVGRTILVLYCVMPRYLWYYSAAVQGPCNRPCARRRSPRSVDRFSRDERRETPPDETAYAKDRQTDSFDWDRSQDPHIPPNSISSQLRLWHGLWLCIYCLLHLASSRHTRPTGARSDVGSIPCYLLAKPVCGDDRTGDRE